MTLRAARIRYVQLLEQLLQHRPHVVRNVRERRPNRTGRMAEQLHRRLHDRDLEAFAQLAKLVDGVDHTLVKGPQRSAISPLVRDAAASIDASGQKHATEEVNPCAPAAKYAPTRSSPTPASQTSRSGPRVRVTCSRSRWNSANVTTSVFEGHEVRDVARELLEASRRERGAIPRVNRRHRASSTLRSRDSSREAVGIWHRVVGWKNQNAGRTVALGFAARARRRWLR